MKRIIGLIFTLAAFSGIANAESATISKEMAQPETALDYGRHKHHRHLFRLWSRHRHHDRDKGRHSDYRDKGRNGHDRNNGRHQNNIGHGRHDRHKEEVKTGTENK